MNEFSYNELLDNEISCKASADFLASSVSSGCCKNCQFSKIPWLFHASGLSASESRFCPRRMSRLIFNSTHGWIKIYGIARRIRDRYRVHRRIVFMSTKVLNIAREFPPNCKSRLGAMWIYARFIFARKRQWHCGDGTFLFSSLLHVRQGTRLLTQFAIPIATFIAFLVAFSHFRYVLSFPEKGPSHLTLELIDDEIGWIFLLKFFGFVYSGKTFSFNFWVWNNLWWNGLKLHLEFFGESISVFECFFFILKGLRYCPGIFN